MGWPEYYARQKRLRAVKNKTAHLERLLKERGIPGQVWFSWSTPPGMGWMHALPRKNDTPQRLGHDFAQAVDLIESGTMDFMKGWTP